ncbi:hypothetical protein [Bradyrhizobium sp. SZCCHNRI20481]|uniref:hypothetical protein n=1 Tax=Bradyrhizobium sp. SZCCHNRI20481 TaxID=3057286 RepID=UPI002916D417|nr:hypothetical protein [Bradyrhizobium sp. SZCCHNRI20481]
MLAMGLIFSLSAIGIFCWVLFALSVHALALFVAVTIGIASFHHGSGVAGAVLVGGLAAVLTVGAGRLAYAAVQSAILRGVIAAVFLAPAGMAGYHTAFGLLSFTAPSRTWQIVLAAFAAVLVSGAAWIRLAMLGHPRRFASDGAGRQPHPGL